MQKLKEYFETDTCKSYRPIPFWSWNDKLDSEALVKQIRWMYKNGIGGFFMHARSGLQTEYLSDEWMECIDICAKEAVKLGMKAWAYDENGWPSGFAGGKLLEEEENRDKFILFETGVYDANATVSYLLRENELCRVLNEETEAEATYLNLYIKSATSTADILNPEVVDKFIALTHEQYRKHFGDKFAENIEGFFTDEPQYQRQSTPYTVMLEQYWHETYNEDILDFLGLLFVEKEGYRSFRYRYWKAMQELMLKNYASKVYGWCEENNVKLTGHYIEETSLGGQMMCCAGVMPFYEYEHIPGIDWLGKNSLRVGEISPRQVGSVAAQLGKKQVITETFGCGGWDLSPADLKRIAGFQYVNGVNMMCHHLIPVSERGTRKYDYPAHYSEINPWVCKAFQPFNKYFTRLGYLLGEGAQHINVAMLHPMRSVYFDYKRELKKEGFGIAEFDKTFLADCRVLSSRNVEYHFLDETLLAKHGFVEGTQIGCGECKYDFLVIPHIITMDESTEKLIHAFVKNGGKVLLLGDRPSYREASEYKYDYLKSTCSLEDILDAQPFRNINPDTAIYATYRTYDNMKYLYVINGSETNTYEQTFDCGADVHSFKRVNLVDETSTCVPLTITLKPGEDAVLFFSSENAEKRCELQSYEFRLEKDKITWDKNNLVIDKVSYSTDGEHYSEPWLYVALFEKLVKEKFQGKIFFKYEFQVKTVPQEIYLRTEYNDTYDVQSSLNGVALTVSIATQEKYVRCYDVSKVIREGKNEYVLETNWYENPFVHYALFGENVAESLRNMLTYDSELEPIYLEGNFGVYPSYKYEETNDSCWVRGNDFYIGEIPTGVTEPTTDGFPFFAGELRVCKQMIFDSPQVLLSIPGDYHVAEVFVNGESAGRLLFEKELDISHVAKKGMNRVEVRYVVHNRNLYGPHHYINGREGSVSPRTYMLYGTWEGNVSPQAHQTYDLKKFYVKS